MAELIKTITDKGLFEKLFYRFFMKGEVFLKTKSGDLKTKFLGYTNGMAALSIPFIKNMYEQCLIFTRSEQYTVYVHLKLMEKQEDDSYIFMPIKFQVISAARREDRKMLELGGTGKSVIYVTNIISDFIIQNSLAMDLKKVDRVKEIIKFDAEKQFRSVKIYFANEGMTDSRMKFFYEKKEPLLMPDITRKDTAKSEQDFNFYINNFYSKDHHLANRKQLISEIAVPILFKGKIPYGYVQVNHTTQMGESSMTMVKRMAVLVEELFNKYKLFPVNSERLIISDVSKNGVAIVFRERRFIRYFKENSYVYFDLVLPGNKKSSCLGVVRNIGILESKIIKIGCEITEMDALSEVNYDEYLASLGMS